MDRREVFISYSRKDLDLVKGIKAVIEDSAKVSCWMDLNAIESGSPQFTMDIVNGIDNCCMFLFMLSEHSQESEFALLELNYARNEKKKVVIVNIDNCQMIKTFKLLYGLTDTIAWSDQPQREKLLRDIKQWVRPAAEEDGNRDKEPQTSKESFLKLKSDVDCVFFLDGDEKMRLQAGVLAKVPLREGEYELKFVSAENASDMMVEDFVMPSYDKRYDVRLAPLRDKRLEQEARVSMLNDSARKETERKAQEALREVEEARERTEDAAKQKSYEYQFKGDKSCIVKTLPDGLTFNIKGVVFKMVKVEGGSFWMGADNGVRVVKNGLLWDKKEYYTASHNYDSEAYDNEKPVHHVTLSDYYIGETVVTQALWKVVVGHRHNGWEGDKMPVTYLYVNECYDFIQKINQISGKQFRLPTEAEWEYAARGGMKSKGYKYAGSNNIRDVAWYDGNYDTNNPSEVKRKMSNELGLFDMSGNVWEWCHDKYSSYDSSSQTNPIVLKQSGSHVLRGGFWQSKDSSCRVTTRLDSSYVRWYGNIGVRLAMSI